MMHLKELILTLAIFVILNFVFKPRTLPHIFVFSCLFEKGNLDVSLSYIVVHYKSLCSVTPAELTSLLLSDL